MKRLVSGIQPSGMVTIGNYIGAIKQFVKIQNENDDIDFLVFIADLHAITVKQDKTVLRKSIRELAALYLACGLNPEKTHLFIQSEVAEHSQLAYIMESTAYIGELERMTQYKDKKVKQVEGIKASLLTYPALMAADILLYDADLVPIGQDQKQHLELARNLAERFNSQYGDTFTVPDAFIPKIGNKIMSLTNPSKKMSKSDDNQKSYILLLDDINTAKNKIKSAVTDSDGLIRHDKTNKPGISNLLDLYASLTNESIKELEEKYKTSNYAVLKADLAEIVAETLKSIQLKYKEILNSPLVDELLDTGRDYASTIAKRKIYKVYQKIGLGRKR